MSGMAFALALGLGTLAQAQVPGRSGAQALPVARVDEALPCTQVRPAAPLQLVVGKSTVWRSPTSVRRIVVGNPERTPAARLSGEAASSGLQPGEAARSRQGGREPGSSRPPPSAGGPGASLAGGWGGSISGSAGGAAAGSRPGVADVDLLLLAPRELVLQARSVGATNFVLVDDSGTCMTLDVVVGLDTSWLRATLAHLMPDERDIRITPAFDAVVLSGGVSDSDALARVSELAQAFLRAHDGGASQGRRLVNLLQVGAPQQVMLEVKVAEVSKVLIEKLGVQFGGRDSRGSWNYNFLADFLTGGAGSVGLGRVGGALGLDVDAQKDDALVKVLAEPTVMALSGQTGSFLAGGKIFIPVAQDAVGGGGRTVTLEEKEFGVSLRFTPTVLGQGRIHLKVRPEVSELNREGVGIVAGGVNGTAVLPSFTARRAETTVQLMDGQSFAIGGLIRHNATTGIKAFPFLGELPIIGPLFRSTAFQSDRSELVFVITPRLVKPLPVDHRLPTDGYVEPTREQRVLEGRLEGAPREEGAVRELQRVQQHDEAASRRHGSEVTPTDARVLVAPQGAAVIAAQSVTAFAATAASAEDAGAGDVGRGHPGAWPQP
jgi:pilus assembly protein CpaC